MFTTQSVSRVVMATAVAVAGLAVDSTSAHAATMGFNCITNNSAANCAIGTAQLSAQLVDLGNGSVEFMFTNSGPSAASITQIYFDQPTPPVMSFSSLLGSNGVSFQQQTNVGNLPGGAPFSFVATNGYGATAPTSHNGINPTEWLKLVFTLNQGSTFASLLTSMATGDLRIGMHVQAIGTGGSEAFINQSVVPEPTSMLLLGTGLAAAAVRRRRRQAQAQQ